MTTGELTDLLIRTPAAVRSDSTNSPLLPPDVTWHVSELDAALMVAIPAGLNVSPSQQYTTPHDLMLDASSTSTVMVVCSGGLVLVMMSGVALVMVGTRQLPDASVRPSELATSPHKNRLPVRSMSRSSKYGGKHEKSLSDKSMLMTASATLVGSSPKKSLPATSSVAMGAPPFTSPAGKTPLIELPARRRSVSDGDEPNEVGSVPPMLLCSRFTYSRFGRVPSDEGIWPCRPLSSTKNCSRFVMAFTDGIVPVNEFPKA
mmetsp:Transcript_15816/g.49471  ORF Transcript_15816/g.49471 Transcript_15816/m.49471 type:complete len:260 (+) Transcript_15816:1284-2063(+)